MENHTLLWHVMNEETVFDLLKVPSDVIKVGLSDQEAFQRLLIFGPNLIPHKKEDSLWKLI